MGGIERNIIKISPHQFSSPTRGEDEFESEKDDDGNSCDGADL
jgi:hypothetical protein